LLHDRLSQVCRLSGEHGLSLMQTLWTRATWSLKRSTIMKSIASSAVCYRETIAVECKCHLHYQNTERQLLALSGHFN
jgi:hypothetical protein